MKIICIKWILNIELKFLNLKENLRSLFLTSSFL